MRADRLIATLLLMQSRGRVTAAELAADLEVSVATARRDLEALSAAGVPVYPQAGRGGGWSLVGGARTDLSGLTSAEARALFLLAGPSGTPAVRSALRKLVRALPGPFRADAEAAADAVVVDPAGWGAAGRALRPAHADALEDAVVRRRQVRLTYAGRSGETTRRLVDPWGLADKGGVWYLVAGTEGGRRTFRVDRVVAAEVTDEPAHRPDDLALEEVWRQVVAETEQRRAVVSATVLIREDVVHVLRRQFGQHCHVEGPADDGRVRVRVAAHLHRSIAERLAGWGDAVEVVEPAEVRAELAQIGTELVARYAR
ncbi:helix-turn-helix transcriptional regulator [Antribacter gilvus]|uniref:helix-turn-helix transcriptional regulator n=1 Tax=Antribacter gilvus TaxID=2304675 RepID=UPI000F7917CA|nr:YafY family protein [Antribacter gilvus]